MRSRISASNDSIATIEVHATTTVTRTNVTLWARRRSVGCLSLVGYDLKSCSTPRPESTCAATGANAVPKAAASAKERAIAFYGGRDLAVGCRRPIIRRLNGDNDAPEFDTSDAERVYATIWRRAGERRYLCPSRAPIRAPWRVLRRRIRSKRLRVAKAAWIPYRWFLVPPTPEENILPQYRETSQVRDEYRAVSRPIDSHN